MFAKFDEVVEEFVNDFTPDPDEIRKVVNDVAKLYKEDYYKAVDQCEDEVPYVLREMENEIQYRLAMD